MIDENMVPGPALLAAREQLLADIEAAGKIGSQKKAKRGGDNDRPINAVDPNYQMPLTRQDIYLTAAINRAAKYRLVWEATKIRRDKLVAECAAEKTTPPDHYWQEEHRARALYGSALLLVEALS